jgi:hypothetical protein
MRNDDGTNNAADPSTAAPKLYNSTAFHSSTYNRRSLLSTFLMGLTASLSSSLVIDTQPASAAPPFAIMAEELGYFPVQSRADPNITLFVPKRVQRQSTQQAIDLARYMADKGTVVYTAYWCPHCARQRELFGREAWSMISSVECAPRGWQNKASMCISKQIDGYPTWIIPSKRVVSGERSLADLAKVVGYKGFDESLESNVPPLVGQSCAFPKSK